MRLLKWLCYQKETKYNNTSVHKYFCWETIPFANRNVWQKFSFCLQTPHQVTNMTVDIFSIWTQIQPSSPQSYNKLSSWTEMPLYLELAKEERCLEGISGISKTSSLARSRIWKYKPFFWEECLWGCWPLLKKGCQGNWFPKNHFTVLSHLGTQRLLQSWSNRTLLLFVLVANLGVIHKMLVFFFSKMLVLLAQILRTVGSRRLLSRFQRKA